MTMESTTLTLDGYLETLPETIDPENRAEHLNPILVAMLELTPLEQGGYVTKLAQRFGVTRAELRAQLAWMQNQAKSEAREKKAPISQKDAIALTDLGNSQRLRRILESDGELLIRWDEGSQEYWHYTGKVWSPNPTAVRKVASDMVLRYYQESDNEVEESHWLRSQSRRALDNMVDLLKDRTGVLVSKRTPFWDQHPYLVNFENGTLDLITREFRAHRASDHLTQIIPHNFNPDAQCPVWLQFLETSQPDRETRDWMQRWDGACLSAGNLEQYLLINHGAAGAGKGTRRRALDHAFGRDYAAKLHRSVFERQPGAPAHPTNVMDAKSKRLIYGQELSRSLNIVQLKELTGGDEIKGHLMGKDFETLSPTWRTEIDMNGDPDFPEDPEGAVMSRVRAINWKISFRNTDKQDKSLDEKLKAEAEGILAWCVRGFYLYRESGFPKVEAIEVATQNIATVNDRLQDFLDEHCLDCDGYLEKNALWEVRRSWNEARKENRYETRRAFERALVGKNWQSGLHPKTRRATWLYKSLKTTYNPPPRGIDAEELALQLMDEPNPPELDDATYHVPDPTHDTSTAIPEPYEFTSIVCGLPTPDGTCPSDGWRTEWRSNGAILISCLKCERARVANPAEVEFLNDLQVTIPLA